MFMACGAAPPLQNYNTALPKLHVPRRGKEKKNATEYFACGERKETETETTSPFGKWRTRLRCAAPHRTYIKTLCSPCMLGRRKNKNNACSFHMLKKRRKEKGKDQLKTQARISMACGTPPHHHRQKELVHMAAMSRGPFCEGR